MLLFNRARSKIKECAVCYCISINWFIFFLIHNLVSFTCSLVFQHRPRMNAFVTIRSSSSSSSPSGRHFRLRQSSCRISRTRSLSLRITELRFSLSLSLSFSFPFIPLFIFRSSFPEEIRRPTTRALSWPTRHSLWLINPSNNRSKQTQTILSFGISSVLDCKTVLPRKWSYIHNEIILINRLIKIRKIRPTGNKRAVWLNYIL